MVLRIGFKQTETGIIPEDWKIALLQDISERIMVGIASAATHAYRTNGIVLLRNQNIKSGYLQDDDLLFIDEEYETIFKNKRLKTGDLITARTGYPGTTCIVPPKYDGAQCFTTLITRVKDGIVDRKYLCYYINSEIGKSFFERNKIGGGQKNVGANTLKLLPVVLPPLPEQCAIAAALSNVDALLASLDALIAKKRLIQQGAMQELLTGKRRLPGYGPNKYLETEMGRIPADWDFVPIDKIAEQRSERNLSDSELPVLTCSKHLGFVDSLKYFKNQVFSNDTSVYKIIRRGELGVPC